MLGKGSTAVSRGLCGLEVEPVLSGASELFE
jgi:hypothetical protein